MILRTLERIKQQWQFAADSMPQLIFLVDRAGRVMHANRTLERWKLGEVQAVRGIDLHDVVHKRCSDPDCYLRLFGNGLPRHWPRPECRCDIWDPLLKRHLEIRTQMPVQEEGADAEDFAVVTIDDLTESKASEDRSRRTTQILNRRIEHEQRMCAKRCGPKRRFGPPRMRCGACRPST